VPGDDDLIGTLEELGASREAAEEAIARGDPEGAVFESVLLPARLDRTVSAIDVEGRGGISVEEAMVLMEARGLPTPDPGEPTFTPDEADVLVEVGKLRDIWPPEVMLQVSRVYGRMLARIAAAEIQAFRHHTAPKLREDHDDTFAELRAVQAAFEALLPLADPLLIGVHRRWVEHELAQVAVNDAEQRADGAQLPGAVNVAFLFCDLKDFTEYADAHGDAEAIGAIEAFFSAVTAERGETGRVVKLLGDGAMLAYDDAVDAVAAGARLIATMRSTDLPGVHAGVHHGVAIAREGDYFGSAVNLTARLLALGGRDELVGTDPVVEASGHLFSWEPIGDHDIRGVRGPVAVHRLVI
jgi:adenylate cyclase